MPLPTIPISQTQRAAQTLLALAQGSAPLPTPPPLSSGQDASADSQSSIRVVCISDTHCAYPEVPDGDLLLHTGDMTNKGTFDEIQAQLDWLKSLPHKTKVVIAGNHDNLLDTTFVENKPGPNIAPHGGETARRRKGKGKAELDWGAIVYLDNSAATVTVDLPGGEEAAPRKRSLKIFGSPWTPIMRGFPVYPFQYDPGARDPWEGLIPDDTDIFLIHGPPRFHLDQNYGCEHLLREVWRARPPLVVFGHVHAAHGEETVVYDTVRYWHMRAMTTQSWGSLLVLAFHAVLARLGISGSRSPETSRGEASHLVNSAVKSGDRKFDIISFDI
ncbi:uncharacterized protein DNG_01250 [Cephalotrichum gorgonifer]|uniref:Calcineurin-like phosphoesterase domain-containing protein n=1 Tax=Cephalotrichum gorgonifer TaxID=2041049 RepID=A0AAE8SRN3_9PEZI|nr:uncharacterized protein DNG_01250 [Cephalotrichum gorgonifer]